MDPTGIARETGETTRTFFTALKDQPLSLALVVMNFVLLFYLFYSGASITTQRNETTRMIVAWQKETDTLMANCVSKEVLDTIVGALERQLAEMRRQLKDNGIHSPPASPVPRPAPRPPEAPPPVPDDEAKRP